MSSIVVENKGSWYNTKSFLKVVGNNNQYEYIIQQYAEAGLQALKNATPVRTGKTASSWSYEIEKTDKSISIIYNNSNVNKGLNIAMLIQFGHGTRNGGYVEGMDYVNPAIQPVFQLLANSIWKEVTH